MKLSIPNLFRFPHIILIACICYILLPFNFLHFHLEARQAEIRIVSFAVLSVIALLFLSAKIFSREDKAYSLTLVDFSFVLYGLYLAIQPGLYQNANSPEAIIEGFSLLLLYFIVRQLDNGIRFLGFVPVMLSGIFQFFYGIYQLPDPVPITKAITEVYGTYQNTGTFGGAVSVSLVVLLAMLLLTSGSRLNPFVKKGMVLLLVFYGVIVVSSGSRAAVLSVVVTGGYLLFLKYKHSFFILSTGKRRSRGILIASLGIALSGVLYLLRTDSVKGRFFIWGRSMDMIKDNFWFGLGPNGFQNNYMLYQSGFIKQNPQNPLACFADDNLFAFNEWLRIFAEQGIIGVLLLGVLVFAIVRTLVKVFKEDRRGSQMSNAVIASAILLSVSVFSCFSYPLYYFQFKVLLTIAIASVAGVRVLTIDAYRIDNNKVLNINILFGVIILIAAIWGVSLGKQKLAAFSQWNRATKNMAFNKELALKQFKNCRNELSGCVSFLNMYGTILHASQHYKEAEEVFSESLKVRPAYYATVGLGKAYVGNNCTQKAMKLWKEASFMIPTRVEPHYLILKQLWLNNDSAGFYANYNQLMKQKIKINSLKVKSMFFELSNFKFNQIKEE